MRWPALVSARVIGIPLPQPDIENAGAARKGLRQCCCFGNARLIVTL